MKKRFIANTIAIPNKTLNESMTEISDAIIHKQMANIGNLVSEWIKECLGDDFEPTQDWMKANNIRFDRLVSTDPGTWEVYKIIKDGFTVHAAKVDPYSCKLFKIEL